MNTKPIVTNNSLSNLLLKLEDDLRFRSYADITISAHIKSLRHLQPFMYENGYTEYSPNVGEAFLKYINSRYSEVQCSKYKLYLNRLNTIYFGKHVDRCVLSNSSKKYKSLDRNLEILKANLLSLGYTETRIQNYYLKFLYRIKIYLEENELKDYSPDMGDAFIEWYSKEFPGKSTTQYMIKLVRTAVMYLNDTYNEQPFQRSHRTFISDGIPPEFKESTDSFLQACRESGNIDSTLHGKKVYLYHFLSKCAEQNVMTVKEFTPSTVIQASDSIFNYSGGIIVRSFLKYIFLAGFVSNDLSTFVPIIRNEKKMPSTYTELEIIAAEHEIDRSTKLGKRNYAIFLLASRLGIRSGDIIRLKSDHLNFKNGTISFIQFKTKCPIKYTMLPEIREALLDHISCSGINEDGILFRSIFPPYNPLSNTAIGHMVTRLFEKASIDMTGKHHGPHSLRSSMATSMINDHIPYEVVRNVLGHNDPNAIKHYAKIDIENLRRCALNVPEPSGKFLDFLEGKEPYKYEI